MAALQSATMRLMSDLREMNADASEGISASPASEANIFIWNASIIGPNESPWEGGIFQLKLTFSDDYPAKPPKIRFVSEMFHPNVYADGSICLDILQDHWSPVYTVSSVLTSIQSLLNDPNPASPANPEAAKLFTSDVKAYNRKVRRCAERSLDS